MRPVPTGRYEVVAVCRSLHTAPCGSTLPITFNQSPITSEIRRLSFEFSVALVDDDVAIGLTGGNHWENMLGVRHHDIEHVTLL